MLPLEFILTDAHFAINLLAALACFATFWLYLDAWTGAHNFKDLLKWCGFGLLAVGFLVAATQVEQMFLGKTVFAQMGTIGLVLRGLAYALLAVGLALDPLQPVPDGAKELADELPEAAGKPPKKQATAITAVFLGISRMLLPLLSGVVTFLYWRRATTGLERHLRPVAWAFVWFTAFELVDVAAVGRGTTDPRLYDLVAPFGPLWILAHGLLAVAAAILGMWVWQYLTKRLQTQLFMVLTTACIMIFLVTTVSFTFLLMSRVQEQTFSSLDTTANVLNTSIAGLQAETIAAAEVVSQNSDVVNAVVAHDHKKLAQLMSSVLTTKKLSSLVITTESSQVLLRAEDPATWGDSISSDTQVARAAVGKSTHGLIAVDGALSPRLIMKATSPIRNAAGVIVGTATTGFTIDNAYVDGLKQSTGLSAAIYSGDVRVATTLLASDGNSRSVGVKEANKAVTDKVLGKNKTWSGLTTTNGQSYLAVYAPLRDADNVAVGMLFIGQPQVLLLQAAGRSIELTFLIAVGLLVLSIVPVHLISKSLASQLH